MTIPDTVEGVPLDEQYVQGFLDILTTPRGSILYRGAQNWKPLIPQAGQESWVLISNGSGK